ncbi:MAG: hypothetical protein ACFCUE_10085 [Candidatus Bathyarchaeia archaeon]|jgi:hypothetical protein
MNKPNITKKHKAPLTILLVGLICLSMCAFIRPEPTSAADSDTNYYVNTITGGVSTTTHNTVRALGLWWFFFSNDGPKYTSSADGEHWATPTSYSDVLNGSASTASVTVQGSKVMIAYIKSNEGYYTIFGNMSADGSIAWGSPNTLQTGMTTNSAIQATVTSNYLWFVTYTYNNRAYYTADYGIDDSWNTVANSTLHSTSTSSQKQFPIALDNGDIGVFYDRSGIQPKAEYYKQFFCGNLSLGSEQTVSLENTAYSAVAFTCLNGVIYFVCPYNDQMYMRTKAVDNTTWSVGEQISYDIGGTSPTCPLLMSDSLTGTLLLAFYNPNGAENANKVFTITYRAGEWSGIELIISGYTLKGTSTWTLCMASDVSCLGFYWQTSANEIYFKYSELVTTKINYDPTSFSQSSTENGVNSTFSSYWSTIDYIDTDMQLSGYILETDASGEIVNSTWTPFAGSTNNTWANTTVLINRNLGGTVHWRYYINSTSGMWAVMPEQSFIVQATVTFYFNEGGKLLCNGTSIENGTSTTCTSLTTLQMIAAPINSTYIFQSFNWTNSDGSTDATFDNCYDFSVTNKSEFFAYMAIPEIHCPCWYEGYNEGYTKGFADGFDAAQS